MGAKRTRERTDPSAASEHQWALMLITMVKDVGLPGVVVLFFIFLILTNATDLQKQAIIDNYILFKSTVHKYCFAVISFCMFLLITGGIFCRKMLRLEREEVRRLSEWKSEQQNVFEKPLNTTK